MRTAHRLWVVTAVLLLAACNPVEFDPQVSYPGFEQGLVRYSGPSVAWLDAGVSGTAGHVVYAMALVRNEHLTGPRDIVTYVANHPSGHRAFIRHLFDHTIKQQIPAYGHQKMQQLQRAFAESGCNIQKLLIEIALTAALE